MAYLRFRVDLERVQHQRVMVDVEIEAGERVTTESIEIYKREAIGQAKDMARTPPDGTLWHTVKYESTEAELSET